MISKSRAYRWAGVAALAVAGIAATGMAVAEELAPATQPLVRESGLPATRPAKMRRLAAAAATVEMPTDEEWRAVVEFMGKYSPNRLKAIEDSGASERFAAVKKTVWFHYKDLMAVKDRGDQELYDLKLAVVQADDEVWGLQRQMREAPEPDRPVLRHQLRQKMTAMIKLGLKEREMRIARLERALSEEKEKLAADLQGVDQRVDERMRAVGRSPQQQPVRVRRDDAQRPATDAVGSQAK